MAEVGADAAAAQGDDSLYYIDQPATEAFSQKMTTDYRAGRMDVKQFTKVKLSGIAGAKMLMHAKRGCDQGVAETGRPVEIIGMLFGYPDTNDPGAVVITDAFEIPLAGSCHEVAPFQYDEAKGKMGDEFYYFYGTDGGYEGLSAELKRTRPEGNFCGWYHSHPFEPVPGSDHCWFSGIDVTTQTLQQLAFEKDGAPFVGIVVDPQTSLKDGKPHFGAFRCYDRGFDVTGEPPALKAGCEGLPAGFKHNNAGKVEATLCPDGVQRTDNEAISTWGGQWNRYYRLPIEFFQSSMATLIMASLKKNFLWVDELAATATATAAFREELPGRVGTLNANLKEMASQLTRSGFKAVEMAPATPGTKGTGAEKVPAAEAALNASRNLATELVGSTMKTVGKRMVLGAT